MISRIPLIVMLSLILGPALAGEEQRWNFKVFLDDKEIGFHNYHLTEIGGMKRIFTEADFRVKFLFITAYKYRHINTETWDDNCLQTIDSWTDANGKEFEVAGSRSAQSFALRTAEAQNEMPGCVKTFAYWDPQFLNESALLNSQTGELMPVTVERLAQQNLFVRGEEKIAERYRVLSQDIDLELWYDEDQQWLGLQSTTKDGHRIRYELI